MKSSILLLALVVIAFSSCTTAYKTGQTPDDVYYSPARPQDEYVRAEREDEREYKSDEYYYDDRYLRMKVSNRSRWSELNDWYYFGDRYRYSYYNNNIWNNPWNPNTYWNNYYNPYFNNYIVVNSKANYTVNRPRTFNLNTYNNNQITNRNYTSTNTGTYSNPKINTSNNSSNSNRSSNSRGSVLRDIFSGGNNNSSSNNNNSSSQPRTTNSSSSSSSSSGSSGSSSTPAPVRKF